MIRVSQVRLPLGYEVERLGETAARALGVRREDVGEVRLVRRAIDARKKGAVCFQATLDVEVAGEAGVLERFAGNAKVGRVPESRYVPPGAGDGAGLDSSVGRPVVVGTGPCGLVAGLILARAGRRPILLERGQDVGRRGRQVKGFWRHGWDFDPESNVQFGEGGAGTFSDGKLYTQIRDREGRVRWLLEELARAGAPEDILVKARPHIGTDRLIRVVRRLREEILELGGEVRFGERVDGLEIEGGRVRGVQLASGEEIVSGTVVLAVGHSARDTFEMLHAAGVPMEAKPFSVGVRIEHPQSVIDAGQYGKAAGHALLGSAPYKFTWHDRSRGRSAYSFCMCPGGLVVASGSEEGMVVTNGMSRYARAEANANSGFMVGVDPEDYGGSAEDPLAGIRYQRDLERKAFVAGGGDYFAPAQLLGDFLEGRASTCGGAVEASYAPGVRWGDMRECLPEEVVKTLKRAVRPIARRLAGFDMKEAVMTGVETRSSSPVRVARDEESLQCVGVGGLYPAGEGAGYAGGIVSAAVDGMRVAEAILLGK